MKNFNRIISVIITAAFLVFLLVGASITENKADHEDTDSDKSDTETSASFNPYNTTIGISMPSRKLERWNRDGALLKKQFEDRGYQVELIYADDSYEKQNKDIQKLMNDHVNLLVIAAVDASTPTKTLDKAKEAGIPIISYDRLIMNTDAISYNVSFNNYVVGKLQGQYIVKALGLTNYDVTRNIEFAEGDASDSNAALYYNGEYDVLKPYIDNGNIRVVSGQTDYDKVTTDGWSTANAEKRMKNILKSFYADRQRLDAVVCANDYTALGVTRAIDEEYQGRNNVIITGQDGDEENLKNIVDGKQSMTVFKALSNEVIVTVDLADEILKGLTPGESLIRNSNWGFKCTYDTLSYDNGTGAIPSYLLMPTAVTKENMQKVLVDTGYYTVDKDGYLHPAD